jgi:hypothetical protein
MREKGCVSVSVWEMEGGYVYDCSYVTMCSCV